MSLSIFAAAAEFPTREALIEGDRTLTYRDLAGRVHEAVGRLRRQGGLERGPVAVVARHDVPTLETLYALMATGTPAVLLHPRLTAPERDDLLDHVRRAWPGRAIPLLSGDTDGVAHRGPGTVGTDTRRAEADGVDASRSGTGRVEAGPGDATPHGAALPEPDPEAPLAVVFTSGTTGAPRAAVLARRAFLASAAASEANLGWQEGDRWLLPLPVAHVGGLSIVTRCLLARRTVVLCGDTDPPGLVDAMERRRVTLASMVPTMLARVLDLDPPPVRPSRLRAVLLGGAGASTGLLARAADRGWPILTTYGLTEACSQVATQPYGTVNRGEGGSGRPLPGIDVRIAADGEIEVRGPTMFSGYVPRREPDLHDGSAPPANRPGPPGAEPELDRPFLEGGWLPTGDRGRLDANGHLHVAGRRADRIVTGGENVDPVEVERALESLPDVREACVFGVPDEEWGELVCAVVVVAAGADFDAGAAAAGLRGRLAAFKHPRRVAVVGSPPRNALGKLDRREAARLMAGG